MAINSVNNYVLSGKNGFVTLCPAEKLSRPLLSEDTVVNVEKSGNGDFTMHVLSGDKDKAAKAFDVMA